MAHPKVSQKRADAISASLFLIGLAIVFLTNSFWPGMMLVIGIPLALKQFLLGRVYDSLLSLVVFVGIFCVSGFSIPWDVLLPVIFIVAALYIILREFCNPYPTTEAEDEESLNHEITEDEDD